jgi:hypothetical protein
MLGSQGCRSQEVAETARLCIAQVYAVIDRRVCTVLMSCHSVTVA